MTGKKYISIGMLIFFSLSCSFASQLFQRARVSENEQGTAIEEHVFSDIIFCEDVTDEGEPINPSSSYPYGTMTVWAYFTYEDMQDGKEWGRLWLKGGEEFFDARGETWVDGESGWVAYSISAEDGMPLAGKYTLVLYLDEEPVKEASFKVAKLDRSAQTSLPSFGPIQFASEITEERAPVGLATQFPPDTYQVYAVWPYNNIAPDQVWAKEWLQDGVVIAESQEAWGTPSEGVTYLSLQGPDEGTLAPATYTLNLYLDGNLTRSASFEILSGKATPEKEPAKPEDVIDPELMQAWILLNNAYDNYSYLHDLAQFVLDYHIPIVMDERHADNVAGYYQYSLDSCQPNFYVGDVYVFRDYWNNNSWEAIAALLAHELTHAQQHRSGDFRCPGCSIYAEYHARIAEFYTLLMLNRTDLIYDWDVFDSNGKFSPDMLWWMTKRIYGEDCPDY